jgi:hypothetical protein
MAKQWNKDRFEPPHPADDHVDKSWELNSENEFHEDEPRDDETVTNILNGV